MNYPQPQLNKDQGDCLRLPDCQNPINTAAVVAMG